MSTFFAFRPNIGYVALARQPTHLAAGIAGAGGPDENGRVVDHEETLLRGLNVLEQ